MRLLVVILAALMLSGCTSGSSAKGAWSGGSGDIDLKLDCGDHVDLEIRSDATEGQLHLAVADGADNIVVVFDLGDEELRNLDQRLEGEPGEWKVGGSYDSMERAGSVQISC